MAGASFAGCEGPRASLPTNKFLWAAIYARCARLNCRGHLARKMPVWAGLPTPAFSGAEGGVSALGGRPKADQPADPGFRRGRRGQRAGGAAEGRSARRPRLPLPVAWGWCGCVGLRRAFDVFVIWGLLTGTRRLNGYYKRTAACFSCGLLYLVVGIGPGCFGCFGCFGALVFGAMFPVLLVHWTFTCLVVPPAFLPPAYGWQGCGSLWAALLDGSFLIGGWREVRCFAMFYQLSHTRQSYLACLGVQGVDGGSCCSWLWHPPWACSWSVDLARSSGAS